MEGHYLYGKQGYGNARGIWQTVYLEARGETYLDTVHFTPDIDNGHVTAEVTLGAPAKKPLAVQFVFKAADRAEPAVAAFAPYLLLAGLVLLIVAAARPRTSIARSSNSVEAIAIAMR